MDIRLIILISITTAFVGCSDRDDYLSIKGTHDGFIPVYQDSAPRMLDAIESQPPKSMINPGKIYLYKKLLFINEQSKGVHVYDNHDPAFPQPVCFIKIPGNFDITCKDSTMFAESSVGLITMNISNLPAISDIRFADSSIKNDIYVPSFIITDPNFLQAIDGQDFGRRVFFECIDPSKGYVKEWVPAKLTNPKCFKYE